MISKCATVNTYAVYGILTLLTVTVQPYPNHGESATNLLESSEDTIDMVFLSNVNQLKLHQNEYHVIKINTPLSLEKTSYIMHLSKPDDLYSDGHLGIHEKDMIDLHCVFSGTIVSSMTNKKAGMASLSSCHHDHSFEGLISLENRHYYITPFSSSFPYSPHLNLADRTPQRVSRSINHYRGLFSKHVIRHRISAPNISSNEVSIKKHRNDIRFVPPEELRKAQEEMLKDQETLEDEDEDDDDVTETVTDDENNNSVTMNSLHNFYVDLDCEEDDCNSAELAAEYAIRGMFTGNKNTKKGKKVARVVELAVFTDESFYRKWLAKYPTDTEKRINQYILTLVNNMNYMYHQPSINNKMSIRLVHVGLQKTTPKGLKVSAIGDAYVESFCKFAGKKDKKGAVWDHAMMFTGLNLVDPYGNPGEIGIAFTSAMCLRYWSCSLIEFTRGFETAFTAAHELGHSLGMEHDGDGINKNCDASKFIMAAMADKGQINWSPCSNQNLKNFLSTGNPRPKVKDPSSVPKCLTKRGSKRSKIKYQTGSFPGQKFNTTRQCQTACVGCKPYTSTVHPYNKICWMLHCQGPPGIVGVHPALEGTKCGGGKKKCRNGKCQ